MDIGSTSVKMVAVDGDGRIVRHLLEPTEPLIEEQISRLLGEETGFDAYTKKLPLVATGYGRKLVKRASKQVTEIKCHAKGAFHVMGHGGTLVDIGGQDSKVISVGEDGKVLNFAMNDKCAAGTGRFLENTALRLNIPMDKMGKVALASETELPISSTCAVFAESEIVSLLAHGAPLEQIVRGLHHALVERIASLVRSLGSAPPLIASGGVARNPAIKVLLARKLGQQVLIGDHPELTGAYGAALLALEDKLCLIY